MFSLLAVKDSVAAPGFRLALLPACWPESWPRGHVRDRKNRLSCNPESESEERPIHFFSAKQQRGEWEVDERVSAGEKQEEQWQERKCEGHKRIPIQIHPD